MRTKKRTLSTVMLDFGPASDARFLVRIYNTFQKAGLPRYGELMWSTLTSRCGGVTAAYRVNLKKRTQETRPRSTWSWHAARPPNLPV